MQGCKQHARARVRFLTENSETHESGQSSHLSLDIEKSLSRSVKLSVWPTSLDGRSPSHVLLDENPAARNKQTNGDIFRILHTTRRSLCFVTRPSTEIAAASPKAQIRRKQGCPLDKSKLRKSPSPEWQSPRRCLQSSETSDGDAAPSIQVKSRIQREFQ
jgi:hypothetical protein